MTAKYRSEYRRRKRAERAAEISAVDREMLDLMERLRRHTFGGALGDSPRCVAMRNLMQAIDGMAEAITVNRLETAIPLWGWPHRGCSSGRSMDH